VPYIRYLDLGGRRGCNASWYRWGPNQSKSFENNVYDLWSAGKDNCRLAVVAGLSVSRCVLQGCAIIIL